MEEKQYKVVDRLYIQYTDADGGTRHYGIYTIGKDVWEREYVIYSQTLFEEYHRTVTVAELRRRQTHHFAEFYETAQTCVKVLNRALDEIEKEENGKETRNQPHQR